ncbi:MAG TPA: hypothetical protein VG228_04130 [Solirubrobacteraceae bacterium]|jgi:hypothetical protein|nr:hypothetical protein [Solirubrobacteraceae bacterium]
MSAVKVAVACGLVALLISACGIPPKPEAGTPHLRKQPGTHARTDDPRVKHVACLRSAKIHFHQYYTAEHHLPAIQVGSLPNGPTIIFYPTPGIAQGLQIMGEEQAAEVIGGALLYPNKATGNELSTIENCTATGVTG